MQAYRKLSELRTTPSGQSVTSIRVATNRAWTDKEGKKQESVQFHAVVIWAKQAEVASTFLQKGSTVLIEGRLETREWTDKDGVKRWATEIICEQLQLGPRPAEGSVKSATAGASQPEKAAAATLIPASQTPDYDEGEGRALTPAFGEDDINAGEIPF